METIIKNIHSSPSEIRIGPFNGQDADCKFYIKGDDVVITKQNDEFVSILKGGINDGFTETLRGELSELSQLSKEVTAAVGQISDIRDELDGVGAKELSESIAAVTAALAELMKRRGDLLKQISDADLKIKQKREAKLAIERENCMSVSAALRTIPKDVHKDEDDELLKVLRE